jgi:hypothetical protein
MHVATLDERGAIAERGSPASFALFFCFLSGRFDGFPRYASARRSLGVAAETRKTFATRSYTRPLPTFP